MSKVEYLDQLRESFFNARSPMVTDITNDNPFNEPGIEHTYTDWDKLRNAEKAKEFFSVMRNAELKAREAKEAGIVFTMEDYLNAIKDSKK